MKTLLLTWQNGQWKKSGSSSRRTGPFNRIDAARSNKLGPVVPVLADLNRTQQRVLDEIRNNPNVTHDKLAMAIGKSATTAQKAVRFLRENGYIERVGSGRAGWWRVLWLRQWNSVSLIERRRHRH